MKCPVCSLEGEHPLEARVKLLESLIIEGLKNAVDIEAPEDSWLGRCRKAMDTGKEVI